MKSGFVLLLALLVLGAVSLLVASTLLLAGVDATRTSGTLRQTSEARNLADACAEIGLDVVKNEANFVGSGVVTFEPGRTECQYHVANSTDSSHRQLLACGKANEALRRVNLLVTRAATGKLTIDQWRETAAFTATPPYAPSDYQIPAICQSFTN